MADLTEAVDQMHPLYAQMDSGAITVRGRVGPTWKLAIDAGVTVKLEANDDLSPDELEELLRAGFHAWLGASDDVWLVCKKGSEAVGTFRVAADGSGRPSDVGASDAVAPLFRDLLRVHRVVFLELHQELRSIREAELRNVRRYEKAAADQGARLAVGEAVTSRERLASEGFRTFLELYGGSRAATTSAPATPESVAAAVRADPAVLRSLLEGLSPQELSTLTDLILDAGAAKVAALTADMPADGPPPGIDDSCDPPPKKRGR